MQMLFKSPHSHLIFSLICQRTDFFSAVHMLVCKFALSGEFSDEKIQWSSCISCFYCIYGAGCASTHRTEGTGEYFDDSVITTKVKTAIINALDLKSSEINVQTFKGLVHLSGFVGTKAKINKAGSVAHDVKGKMICDLNNELCVNRHSAQFSYSLPFFTCWPYCIFAALMQFVLASFARLSHVSFATA
jgi:hypothetical protein